MAGVISVIDMSKIKDIPSHVKADKDWNEVAKEIRSGLGDIGFIYLKNHGVDDSVVTKIYEQSKAFFDLPQATKLKYKKSNLNKLSETLDHYVGYTPPGGELLHPDSVFELRETFDYVENVGMYPDEEIPEFKNAFDDLNIHCKRLTKKILILLALSLELDDPEFFLSRFTWLHDYSLQRAANIRTLFYPPLSSTNDIPPNTVRCGEHSDYGMLTFLFQDTMGGLEVSTVDGKWVPATPIPGTIVVNAGDLLEFWSAGVFPATLHRVLIPEDKEIQQNARFSTAFFIAPNTDTLVAPMKIKKKENEVKRLLLGNSRVDYDKMEPVNSMDYISDRIKTSYITRTQKREESA